VENNFLFLMLDGKYLKFFSFKLSKPFYKIELFIKNKTYFQSLLGRFNRVGFCIENCLQKTETVPHGFSIHFSSHFLDYG
jgi:hypothetical protein